VEGKGVDLGDARRGDGDHVHEPAIHHDQPPPVGGQRGLEVAGDKTAGVDRSDQVVPVVELVDQDRGG